MKDTSLLGAAIEDAVTGDPRFARQRPNVSYLCCFRTATGTVFAFERVTQGHINLWVPDQNAARDAAEAAHLTVQRTTAWPDGSKPDIYGRISSLKSIPELRDAPLYRIAVSTTGQALTVLSALQ